MWSENMSALSLLILKTSRTKILCGYACIICGGQEYRIVLGGFSWLIIWLGNGSTCKSSSWLRVSQQQAAWIGLVEAFKFMWSHVFPCNSHQILSHLGEQFDWELNRTIYIWFHFSYYSYGVSCNCLSISTSSYWRLIIKVVQKLASLGHGACIMMIHFWFIHESYGNNINTTLIWTKLINWCTIWLILFAHGSRHARI